MAFETDSETLEGEPTQALLTQADRAAKRAEEQAERAALEALEAKALVLMREAAALDSPKQRLDLLLDAADIDTLVPSMPAEQLFFMVQGVGLSDALELVHLSSPEQFVSFIDLDAWKRDELSVEKVITWLRAAGTDADDERFERKLAALDIEVLERMLQSALRIWDLEETPDPDPEGEVFRSP
ncbi:MAG: DUF6178 family protein, partial [Myxococcales bacterium]|nr:DUF6178 family protein [Myxococcales bacterium]